MENNYYKTNLLKNWCFIFLQQNGENSSIITFYVLWEKNKKKPQNSLFVEVPIDELYGQFCLIQFKWWNIRLFWGDFDNAIH